MKPIQMLLAALLPLGLALEMGCVATSSTADTALYVFDSDAVEIEVWDDLETLYSTTTTSPTRTLSGSNCTYLTDLTPLAWGGMCIDRAQGRMWLVSETGLIGRIDSIRSRTSSNLTSSYIRTFQLGSDDNDRISNGYFGQIAVDPATGYLYVTEYSSSTSRIWVLSSPTDISQDSTVASSDATILQVSSDKYGYGIAIGNSSRFYAYADSGNTVTDANDNTYSGARLRTGTASGGFDKYPIIGSSTGLAQYGLLGADASNNLLYLARYDNTAIPVAVYAASKFSTGYNVSPTATLPGSTSSPIYLRVLATAGNKDWVVGTGAGTSDGDYANQIHLWKSPSTDTTTEPVAINFDSTTTTTTSTTYLRGIALDGNAAAN